MAVSGKDGNNDIKITAQAAYGNKKEYIIHVYRPYPEANGEAEHIKTAYILDGDYIYGIEPKTSISDFLKNFTVVEGNRVRVKNADGEYVTEGYMGTKYVVCTPSQKFTVIISAEISQDGEIDFYDLLYIKMYMIKEFLITLLLQIPTAIFIKLSVH